MTLDNQSLFSDGQTLATSTGSTASAYTLDTKAHGDDVGRNLSWFCLMTAGAGDTTSTLAVALQTSANNSDWTTLATKTVTAPAAGAMIVDGEPLPDGLKRYLRVNYTVGTAAFTTAATLTAGLVRNDVPKKRQAT